MNFLTEIPLIVRKSIVKISTKNRCHLIFHLPLQYSKSESWEHDAWAQQRVFLKSDKKYYALQPSTHTQTQSSFVSYSIEKDFTLEEKKRILWLKKERKKNLEGKKIVNKNVNHLNIDLLTLSSLLGIRFHIYSIYLWFIFYHFLFCSRFPKLHSLIDIFCYGVVCMCFLLLLFFVLFGFKLDAICNRQSPVIVNARAYNVFWLCFFLALEPFLSFNVLIRFVW